jgi:hypothetical protein
MSSSSSSSSAASLNPWNTSAQLKRMDIQDVNVSDSVPLAGGLGFVVDPMRAEELIRSLRVFKIEVCVL